MGLWVRRVEAKLLGVVMTVQEELERRSRKTMRRGWIVSIDVV